jgi:alpha-glucosidase
MAGERYAADVTLRSFRESPGTSEAGGTVLRLDLSGAVAEIGIASDGVVRLRAATGDRLPSPAEDALERGPWRPVSASARERESGGVALVSPNAPVQVEVTADPFAVRVRDRRSAPVAVLSGLSFASGGASRISLAVAPSERFFGFGEKPGGLDKRGSRLTMRNRDPETQVQRDPLYVSIPFFLVRRPAGEGGGCCGVLLESFGPSRFDVAAKRPDRIELETQADGLDVLVFPGPEPADVVRRFTERVGRCPLPPLWALGHHQSRWSYASENEVRRLAGEIRERGIPTDAIHLDIDYMDGYRVFTWNAKRFPDPPGLLKQLSEQGLRVVTIIDPGVKVDPEFAVHRDGSERDVFCRTDEGEPWSLRVWPGQASLPDFNRAEVRAWWGEQHRPLLEAGVAGIWNDMNEPAGWARDVRLGRLMVPLRRQDMSRVVQSDPAQPERSVPHEQVRNLYGLQQCRATREALESHGQERRPFLLTRSGYAGIQRYAAVWTGDNASRWSHLRESVPMLLNLSLSGVPFCGADIGGFFLSCTPELYARWIQLGALYPFARTHSVWASRRQEPWRFGARVERIAREALELRMRLLPYVYALFREAERSGAPVWRPLFYEFPQDDRAPEVEDQVMLGPSVLIAPVLDRGVRERSVYLPEGSWFDWHDGARFTGPRRVRVPAPLERLPLFVRGGAVLPTRSPVRHVDEVSDEPLVLEVFPGADATLDLVEDDGDTLAYRGDVVAHTPLRLWSRAGGRLRLELGRREGPYAIAERPLRVAVHGCPLPDAVHLDGTQISRGEEPPGWNVVDGRVDVRLVDRGMGASIEIEPAP